MATMGPQPSLNGGQMPARKLIFAKRTPRTAPPGSLARKQSAQGRKVSLTPPYVPTMFPAPKGQGWPDGERARVRKRPSRVGTPQGRRPDHCGWWTGRTAALWEAAYPRYARVTLGFCQATTHAGIHTHEGTQQKQEETPRTPNPAPSANLPKAGLEPTGSRKLSSFPLQPRGSVPWAAFSRHFGAARVTPVPLTAVRGAA
jgi:hypothetical protein